MLSARQQIILVSTVFPEVERAQCLHLFAGMAVGTPVRVWLLAAKLQLTAIAGPQAHIGAADLI